MFHWKLRLKKKIKIPAIHISHPWKTRIFLWVPFNTSFFPFLFFFLPLLHFFLRTRGEFFHAFYNTRTWYRAAWLEGLEGVWRAEIELPLRRDDPPVGTKSLLRGEGRPPRLNPALSSRSVDANARCIRRYNGIGALFLSAAYSY